MNLFYNKTTKNISFTDLMLIKNYVAFTGTAYISKIEEMTYINNTMIERTKIKAKSKTHE